MVMELCQAELYQLVEKFGAITDRQFLRSIFSQLCFAVQTIHNAGYCHLDIKIENVLISQDNTIRLSDFGFARSCELQIAQIYGTDGFMAPEILELKHN